MISLAARQMWANSVDPEAPGEDPSESPPVDFGEGVDQAVTVTVDTVGVLLACVIGAAIGLLVAILLTVIAQAIGRRHPIVEPALDPPKRPFQLALTLAGAWVAFTVNTSVPDGETEPGWRHPIFHAFLIAVILAGTWFIASIVVGFERAVIRRVERTATKRAKRIQTQFQIVRRVLVAVIWTLGVAGVLITFPTARAAGASILASAGIFSVIAGLAAQSTLGNVFAGLQVAFSDSLRVDDVVIMNGEYCVVEEITLTYVVLKVWDGRRIIVPSSKLTTETFENWTRREADMMGKVFFDLDWQVPVDAMRSEMVRCLDATKLWDRRAGVLQVDSAENGRVRIAILVSAVDSATLTDLRNYVREHMVKWIQAHVPRALPYSRNIYASIDDLNTAFDDYPNPEEFVEVVEPDPVAKPQVKLQPSDMEETVILPKDYFPIRRPVSERSPLEVSEEELSASPTTAGVTTTNVKPGHEASIFTGSPEAEERAKDFSGPGEAAIAERERRAAERTGVKEDDAQRPDPDKIDNSTDGPSQEWDTEASETEEN